MAAAVSGSIEPPLIVIVGPTASGKSAAAMELAQAIGGEIIAADSRTIYKGLDIGTAKPSAGDQALVPHHGLDLVTPDQSFSAAKFKDLAVETIADIRRRGNVPIMVGGTGLYIDGVIFDYEFGQPAPELRRQLEQLSIKQLQKYCSDNNIELPANSFNRRHLIRAIEQKSINRKRLSAPIPDTVIVGITTNKEILRQRIQKRADQIVKNGVMDEAEKAAEIYGWEAPGLSGIVYRLCRKFIEKSIDHDELISLFSTADWQLAKRQLTWFKRNPYIHWMALEDVKAFVIKHIDN